MNTQKRHLNAILGVIAFAVLGTPARAADPRAQPSEAAAVFEQAARSIVIVEAKVPSGISQGSGVVIGDREIVTNHHVIDESQDFVLVRQGPRVWRAEVIAKSPETDLALLWVVLRPNEQFKLPAARMRASGTLRVGEPTYAIGAPQGLECSLSNGLISGLPNDGALIQTTAAISPGSSGGGLFDARSRLIGVTALQLRNAQNLNFAIPTDKITPLQARASEMPPTPYSLNPSAVPALRCGLPTSLNPRRAFLVSATFEGDNGRWAPAEAITSAVVGQLRQAHLEATAELDDAEKLARSLRTWPPTHIFIENKLNNNTWTIEISVTDRREFSNGTSELVVLWRSESKAGNSEDASRNLDIAIADLIKQIQHQQ